MIEPNLEPTLLPQKTCCPFPRWFLEQILSFPKDQEVRPRNMLTFIGCWGKKLLGAHRCLEDREEGQKPEGTKGSGVNLALTLPPQT